VVDVMPAMDGLEAGIAAHAVRLCAVCDGYEASDADIAVLAPVDVAIRHAAFLRSFSQRVAAIPTEAGEPSPDCATLAGQAGIELLPPAIALRCDAEGCVVDTEAGERRFDTLYPVLGCDAQSRLGTMLGAAVDDNGELTVDARMQTSVDGLYAIGDVVSALNQISVAMGHAAIAASTFPSCNSRSPSSIVARVHARYSASACSMLARAAAMSCFRSAACASSQ